MDNIERAKGLLIEAHDLIAGAKWLGDNGDLFRSLRSLVKSNDGLYKSDKQGQFLLSQVKRGGGRPDGKIQKMALQKKPDNFSGVVDSIQGFNPGGQFGRKGRIIHYIYFLDSFGVVKELKVLYKYDDQAGSASFKGFKESFERSKSLSDSLSLIEDPWFDEHKDEIAYLTDNLSSHKYFGDFIEDLNNGERISDKMFEKMLDEADRSSGLSGLDKFPSESTEALLEIKVSGLKEYSNSFSYNTISYTFGIWGVAVDYQEKVSLVVSSKIYDELVKKYGDNLKGKTIRIKGKFESDGDVIRKVKRTRLKVL